MKSGVIALIRGGFSELESFHNIQEQDKTEPARSFQVDQVNETPAGREFYTGKAAIQRTETENSVSIHDSTGRISITESPTRQGRWTQFLCIPEEFFVVGSSKGIFGLKLLEEAAPVTTHRAEIDLNAFAEDRYRGEEVDPWKVGFYGNIGAAEKGTIYGDNVFSDDEIGEVLERSQLNQLGFVYEFEGESLKMTASKSGYLEIYQPSTYSEGEYLDYIMDELFDYLVLPQNTDG